MFISVIDARQIVISYRMCYYLGISINSRAAP